MGHIKKKLSDFPEKDRKIWAKLNHVSFEREISIANVSADEVIQKLDYPNYFKLTKQVLPSNKEGILKKFEEERFIERTTKNYQILNLGAVLFANDLNDFELLKRKSLRVVIYPETNRLNTLKEWENKRGYASDFENIVAYILDQIPQNEVIEKAFRRQVKMYPDLLIRELVANTLVHQDFTKRGTGPMVEIFSNRIEFSNPGKPLINTLRFIDHIPESRNEQLASFLRRIEICEERGSGIDKVISAAEAYQLPAPDFIEGDNYLRVVAYAHKSLREMLKSDKIRACYQHCCLQYVNGIAATNESLRLRFNIEKKNYSTVSRIISDTQESGLIKLLNPESRSKKHASYIPFWA